MREFLALVLDYIGQAWVRIAILIQENESLKKEVESLKKDLNAKNP